jgi:TPR repeat protein
MSYFTTPEISALEQKAGQGDARALASLQAKAEHGDTRAQLMLAMDYEEGGDGFREDKAEAFKWFRRAADQGDVLGQFAIGARLHGAEGVRWLRLASERGLPVAQQYLANCYAEGTKYDPQGCKEDLAEAYFWLSLATDDRGGVGYRENLTRVQIATVKKRLKAWRRTHHQLPIHELL